MLLKHTPLGINRSPRWNGRGSSIGYKGRNVERVLFGEKGGDIMRGLKVANSSGQIKSCFVL